MKPVPSLWPEGLLLTYYGDDFTGSTDVMQAFTAAGVPTVLFLEMPRETDLERFKDARCIGLAGQSRGKSPEWMRQELPVVFQRLKALGAPLLQYKVCSTFDSSPSVGSIGQAIELGLHNFQSTWSPMVVGATQLKRFQVFGHLFAADKGVVYRIDRHPTMSRHPVTPMLEADLRQHLAKQTPRRIGLIDLAQIAEGQAQAQLDSSFGQDQPVIMIDVADERSQIEAGRLIWQNRGHGLFSASSSGLQYALTAFWRSQGQIPGTPALPVSSAAPCIAIASGSCSPLSGEQIQWARAHGFLTCRLDISSCLDVTRQQAEVTRLVDMAVAAIEQGVSPLVFSAEGPDDPAVQRFDELASFAKLSRSDASERVGDALAEIMRQVLDQTRIRRIVVAGGDSSGKVGSHLGLRALTVLAGLVPGVPLCRAWSEDPLRDGLEVVFKGGQLGGADFYGLVRG
ncbi:3-oxo-isoapionate kinase OiaK [Limnohabitans sp. Rim8]|uniref:3-oxo-isoapionate kinase OiaK n=1 Tax=Limnohabitans sp. Rim8 TaxID=1100718 RepID=UPI002611BA44|nr:3-oxo-isoapionate kinase OiaK [Limnohabitans sp. Rim8]